MGNKENKENKVPWVAMPIQMFNYDNTKLFILKEDDCAFNLYFKLAKLTQNPWDYGKTVTSVALLSDQMPIVADKTKNRAEHKRLLAVLSDRGYIKISPTNYKNDTPITIGVPNAADTIQKEEKDDEGKKFKFNRFVQVTKEDYESCLGNARYFRAWIYAEHRMFRGQGNEGEWIIHNDEWQNVMGIQSKTTICKLFKDMQSLNIIDKIQGKTYTDKNGNVKNEGSKYIPVSKGVRSDDQEQSEGKKKGEKLAESQNRVVDALATTMDVTDDRVHETNLMNPDKKVKLTGKDIAIYLDTDCEVTKAYVKKRLDGLEKAHPEAYKSLMAAGHKEYDKLKQERAGKKWVEERNNIQLSQEEIESRNKPLVYKKKSNGGVDLSSILD
ncbi:MULTISPECIES: hypothetical protein [Paenibacillus]|uniref:hypothetical protein n=1 Tax=Paenibacillus TaxID=44249 RepID=UPI00096CB183|nr:hypothetical protein [Paenibacillus odorifer]OMD80430.1 hypothetical protein BSK53_20440 [Paenibacillus odorifer]